MPVTKAIAYWPINDLMPMLLHRKCYKRTFLLQNELAEHHKQWLIWSNLPRFTKSKIDHFIREVKRRIQFITG
jgi:hypothetical protein